jgi:purine-cytosine permease-like protein
MRLTHEFTVAPGQGVDSAGKVETRGVDYIPEVERHGRVSDIAWAFCPSQFGLVVAVLGAFPIEFGLSWWSTIGVILLGTAIGSSIIGFQSISGPKSGTTQSVTSGAFFGVNGRLVGVSLALITNVLFLIIIAWTSGQAFEAGFHRLVGTPTGDGSLVVSMVIVVAAMVALGYYGHATLIASYKIVAVINTILQIAIFAVFASHFTDLHGGHYLLGSFWPTWALSLTVIASVPISYGTWPNDYGRYMPADTSPIKLGAMAFGGMFVGCVFVFVLGAFLATTLPSVSTQFVPGVFALAPSVFLPFLLLYAFTGNVMNGSPGVYNAGLDLHAILYFLKRSSVVMIIGAVALIGSYVTVITLNAVDTISALLTVNTVLLTAWMMVNIVGFLMRRNSYYVEDLHAFAISGFRGCYWFSGGVNFRALIAWGAGSALGLMFSTTALFSGPLSASVSGVDISWPVAGVTAGLIYVVLVKIAPEHDVSPALDGYEVVPEVVVPSLETQQTTP